MVTIGAGAPCAPTLHALQNVLVLHQMALKAANATALFANFIIEGVPKREREDTKRRISGPCTETFSVDLLEQLSAVICSLWYLLWLSSLHSDRTGDCTVSWPVGSF